MTSDMKKTFLILLIVLYFTATVSGKKKPLKQSIKSIKTNATQLGTVYRYATVKFKLFLGDTIHGAIESHTRLPGAYPVKFKTLDPSLPVVLIIPTPFSEQLVLDFQATMLKAYSRQSYNLISADWTYSRTDTINGGIAAGKLLALGIEDLCKQGIYFERIISFSTGTIVLSTAASVMSFCRISRIVALDPINKSFQIPRRYWLSKASADLVEVVHTSYGGGGVNKRMGHRDFFPNGGISPQPNCQNEYNGECSRRKAFMWYANALKNRHQRKYKAHVCPRYSDYVAKKCFNKPSVYLNNFKGKNEVPEGKYYLDTTLKTWA